MHSSTYLATGIDSGYATIIAASITQSFRRRHVHGANQRIESGRATVSDLEHLTKSICQESIADADTPQREERLMDVGPSFVADAQSAELMQPAQRPLHDPAVDSQSAAVRCVSFCQKRSD